MKRKPTGQKYRNLVAYRDRIYYDRVIDGRRYWRNLKATDWDDAIVLRDRLEELEGIEKRRGDVPRFDVFAKRYLSEDTEQLAATTLRDRRRYLDENGLSRRLRSALGDLYLERFQKDPTAYASQLLTCGVQLGYVSRQLGHAKPTVTADHYAK